jgi:hypothetical protein
MAPELLDELLVGVGLEAAPEILQRLAYLASLAVRRSSLEILEPLSGFGSSLSKGRAISLTCSSVDLNWP